MHEYSLNLHNHGDRRPPFSSWGQTSFHRYDFTSRALLLFFLVAAFHVSSSIFLFFIGTRFFLHAVPSFLPTAPLGQVSAAPGIDFGNMSMDTWRRTVYREVKLVGGRGNIP